MLVRRLQFTISRLVILIVNFAIFCAFNRSSKVPFIGAWYVGIGLFSKRPEADPGLLGCTIVGLILIGCAFVSVVLADVVQLSLSGKFAGLGMSITWLVYSIFGLLVGAIFGMAINSIPKLAKRYIDGRPLRPAPDDSCGPIVWHRLDDTRDSAS
jgi:hypothetical protein